MFDKIQMILMMKMTVSNNRISRMNYVNNNDQLTRKASIPPGKFLDLVKLGGPAFSIILIGLD